MVFAVGSGLNQGAMKYVILRDDDTNALMPAERLERLYRQFLDRAMPVNLAVIPKVACDAAYLPGRPEKFLMLPPPIGATHASIGQNAELVDYLRRNPLYRVVQHGCSHESVHGEREFDHDDEREIARRLDEGKQILEGAGLGSPTAFVAPYDRISRCGLRAVAARYRVISTGWFELGRLPASWWLPYAVKRIRNAPHWRMSGVALLSHPGCRLSCHHPCDGILQDIAACIARQRLTVLVTHWWEYFPDGGEDRPFINALHQTAEYLASRRDVRVVSFDDVAAHRVALN